MSYLNKYSLLLLFCFFSCSDQTAGVGVEEDNRPVWVFTEGYADENFYSVGIFGGSLDETISERINGAQVDAVNKLRIQLKNQTTWLLGRWADNVADYQRGRISNERLNELVNDVVAEALEKTYHVRTWTDPKSDDIYVLAQLKFLDFTQTIKRPISQLIANAIADHSRRAHLELERLIADFKRDRNKD